MARPQQEGFTYAPIDTDIFEDPQIEIVLNKFGSDAIVIYIKIILMCYKEHGYWCEWDDERRELLSARLHISEEKIEMVVANLVRRSILTEIRTSRPGVKRLTSRGIQKRFQTMARDCHRSYKMDREIWMLSEEDTLTSIFAHAEKNNSGINGDNSGIKDDNSGIKTLNKSKENNKKEINKERNFSNYGRKNPFVIRNREYTEEEYEAMMNDDLEKIDF